MSTFDQFPAWADKLKSTQAHPTEAPKVQPMPVVSFADNPLEGGTVKTYGVDGAPNPVVRKGWPKGKPRKVK